MDQQTPMAEALSASFPLNGRIHILTRSLLVDVDDKIETTPLLGNPVGGYISPGTPDSVAMQVNPFGEVQRLPVTPDISGMHSIALTQNMQIQKIASSEDSRVLGIIAHGYSPSPYLLLLIDGIHYTKIAEFALNEESPTVVRVSHDGGTVAVGYIDGSVRLWNVEMKSELASIRTLPAAATPSPMIGASFLDALCLSPNGSHVFLTQADGRGQIIDRSGGAQPVVVQLPARASACSFDPRGGTIAVGAGGTELLERLNGQPVWSKTDVAAPSSYVVFRDDGGALLFIDANGAHIRRTESGEAVLYLTAHQTSVGSEWSRLVTGRTFRR